MDNNWANYGKWRHGEQRQKIIDAMNNDQDKLELNKIVGAMFLANSLFKTQIHISSQMLDPKSNIDHEERVRYEILQNLSKHAVDTFSKEIKKQKVYDGEVHSLELYIFPTEALKLAVEYIVSTMPQSEIDRIRTTSIHAYEQTR